MLDIELAGRCNDGALVVCGGFWATPTVAAPTAIAKINSEFKTPNTDFCQIGIAATPTVRIPSKALIANAICGLGRGKFEQSALVMAIVIAPARPGVSIDFGLRNSPKGSGDF